MQLLPSTPAGEENHPYPMLGSGADELIHSSALSLRCGTVRYGTLPRLYICPKSPPPHPQPLITSQRNGKVTSWLSAEVRAQHCEREQQPQARGGKTVRWQRSGRSSSRTVGGSTRRRLAAVPFFAHQRCGPPSPRPCAELCWRYRLCLLCQATVVVLPCCVLWSVL